MKFVLFSLLIALTLPTLAQPATKPATTQPTSGTLAGVRKVTVLGDPVKPFESYVNHIASDLGMEILGTSNARAGMDLLRTSTDGTHVVLEVSLDQDGQPAAAKEFLDGIIDRLQKEMQHDFDERRGQQLDLRQAEVDRIGKERQVAESKIHIYRDQLRASTGRLDITPKNLRDAMSKLQDERQTLQLDLRGKEARAAALGKSIAELTEQIEQKNKADDVLVELQKVVDAREKQLELLKQNAGAGLNSPTEVQQVAAQAAEARAKLAERKRDALNLAGGEALVALNRELRMLAVDRAEQEARLAMVSDQLEKIGGVSDLIDKYEEALSTYPKLVEQDQDAQSSIAQIRARLDQSTKPSLRVTYSRNWTESELKK